MKKRILAMLLAFVMLVGSLPISAFATEATDPAITPCETEGCEYASGHEGNCSNYVAPTEACGTEGCSYGAGHEGNCSNYVAPTACETEGCTYAYGHEGDCSPVVDQAAAQTVIDLIAAIGEVTLESEAAISAADTAYNALTEEQKALVTNTDILEAAKAAYTELTAVPEVVEAAAPVDVYLTISSGGVLQLVNGKVTVTDINSDGVLTYEEALIAGHKAHCPAGEAGYEAQESSYGSFVVKLWGVENGGSAYFYMNDHALAYGVSNTENSTVTSGDRLYAANIVDTTSYTDTYTYFTQRYATAEAGSEFVLTLNCENGTAASGVTIGTWSNQTFTVLEGKTTDDNGQVTLSFAEAGTYYVSASGTVTGTDWSGNAVDCPIVPPVCVVTVEEAPASGDSGSSTVPFSVTADGQTALLSYVGEFTGKQYGSGQIPVYHTQVSEIAKISVTCDDGYRTFASDYYNEATLQDMTKDALQPYFTTAGDYYLTTENSVAYVELRDTTFDSVCGVLIELMPAAAGTDTYTVTLPTGEGYTAAASGDSVSPVAAGGSYSFTVTVADGYDGTNMVVKANDTVLNAADGVYTIENINENQTVTVTGVEKEAIFEGAGTAEDPYLIKSAEDLVTLSQKVAAGQSFAGEYFLMTADITLPADWTPVGVDRNAPFSGSFDGGNHLLTVPEGGLPLIGTPKGASLSNLNVYGTKIAGYGVVNNYCEIGKVHAITIENVTLKSGTQTLQSGFIGGYASGSDTATIRNCTVEQGVVIGYDKAQKWVGSFAGEFNGTIENCVSYATVYGTDFVGGIVSNKGQSMGTFTVSNCQFHGDVVATGNYAGGIVGHGYGGTKWGFSSNAGIPSITNCTAAGSVTGANYVGGIYGGDAGVVQVWDNAAGSITGNSFTGTVSATGGEYVGAIIGYLKSLNKNNTIANNFYIANCGAEKGIGYVMYVDTSCETHETESGATYFNTAEGKPGITGVTKTNMNRTDDPLGADADKLCCTDTHTDPIAVELKVSGTCKTTYTTGDKLDLSGIVLTVVYSDTSEKTIDLSDVTVTGYDANKVGEQELTISYNGLTATITVKVENPKGEIKVTVSVYGDSKHGDNGTVHTLSGGGLTTWVSAKTYTVDSNSTVWDVLQKAFADNGITCNAGANNSQGTVYISSLTRNGVTLSEFDNGPNSGWMYTLNGNHSDNGVAQQYLNNGDVIIFHYSDDYIKEQGGSGDDEEDTDAKAAETVEKLIDAIGKVTLNSKSRIDAARKACDALTYTQKQLVDNYATLTAAEAKYAQLKAADDEKKTSAVEDLIDEIYSGSATFEADVKTAQNAYNNLTADQKKLVDNYYKLVNYQKELADEEDKEAAEAVEKLIEDLGTITLDSEEDIKAARVAYEKLTDKQKALVGNLDVLEAAEKKLEELKALAGVEDIYKTTGDYLEDLGTPVSGSTGGEWMVIGLARSGREIEGVEDYYTSVLKYVQENIDENERLHRAKSTDNSRLILALTAIGRDVTNVDGHDLLKGLNDMAYIQKQGINGPIWALLAFDSGNYPVPEGDVSRDKLIEVILDAQLADGGWAMSGENADADMTAMAIQALAPYVDSDRAVKTAVLKAVATLSNTQNGNGSFSSVDGANSESIAQVIVALAALGIDADTDARFVKNGISALDALVSYYVPGGGFRHILDGDLDGMATEQAYYALVAYNRMLQNRNFLYDMTDVIDMGGDVIVEETTEPTEPVEEEENDGNPMLVWVSVMALCAAAAAALVLGRKKFFKG